MTTTATTTDHPHSEAPGLMTGGFSLGTVGVEVADMVSARGGKYGFVYSSRHNVYRALRRKGASKSKAARIANAGRTHAQRSRMAKKAARTRRVRRSR